MAACRRHTCTSRAAWGWMGTTIQTMRTSCPRCGPVPAARPTAQPVRSRARRCWKGAAWHQSCPLWSPLPTGRPWGAWHGQWAMLATAACCPQKQSCSGGSGASRRLRQQQPRQGRPGQRPEGQQLVGQQHHSSPLSSKLTALRHLAAARAWCCWMSQFRSRPSSPSSTLHRWPSSAGGPAGGCGAGHSACFGGCFILIAAPLTSCSLSSSLIPPPGWPTASCTTHITGHTGRRGRRCLCTGMPLPGGSTPARHWRQSAAAPCGGRCHSLLCRSGTGGGRSTRRSMPPATLPALAFRSRGGDGGSGAACSRQQQTTCSTCSSWRPTSRPRRLRTSGQ